MNHYRTLLISVSLVLITACGSNSSKKLKGSDYELFKETPAWNLARAVMNSDTESITSIALESPEILDYQEKQFGNSLLILSIINHDFGSFKALLTLGATPNHYSKKGYSPIMYATLVQSNERSSIDYLRELVKYGADVNDRQPDNGNGIYDTPLLLACGRNRIYSNPLEIVTFLTNNGADINLGDKYGHTPLGQSLVHDNYDVSIYLIENGCDINSPVFNRNGKDIYVWDFLREVMPAINSWEHDQKKKIIAILQNKGIQYSEVPIPAFVIEKAKKRYPNNWEDYLKEY